MSKSGRLVPLSPCWFELAVGLVVPTMIAVIMLSSMPNHMKPHPRSPSESMLISAMNAMAMHFMS